MPTTEKWLPPRFFPIPIVGENIYVSRTNQSFRTLQAMVDVWGYRRPYQWTSKFTLAALSRLNFVSPTFQDISILTSGAISVNGSVAATPWVNGDRPDAVYYDDTTILVSQTQAPQTVTTAGAVVALGGTPPTGQTVEVLKDFVFIAGTATNPSRLHWSAVGNKNSWPVNNFVDIDTGNGEIKMIKAFRDELMIFKSNKTFKLSFATEPNADGRVRLVSEKYGAAIIGKFGVATIPGNRLAVSVIGEDAPDLIGSNDIAIFDGVSFKEISDRRISGHVAFDPGNFAGFRIKPVLSQIYWDGYLHKLVVLDSAPANSEELYFYDPVTDAWGHTSKVTTAGTTGIATMCPSGSRSLFLGMLDNTYQGYDADFSQGFSDKDLEVVTALMDFGFPFRNKRVERFYITVEINQPIVVGGSDPTIQVKLTDDVGTVITKSKDLILAAPNRDFVFDFAPRNSKRFEIQVLLDSSHPNTFITSMGVDVSMEAAYQGQDDV